MAMQNAECRMQNAECRMQNAECRMQNAQRGKGQTNRQNGARVDERGREKKSRKDPIGSTSLYFTSLISVAR
jgi:Tfp pilus assembly protein PilX